MPSVFKIFFAHSETVNCGKLSPIAEKSAFILPETMTAPRLASIKDGLNQIGIFSRGMWRYRRHGEPSPGSNYIVQKLYALTDGRSNDVLFRLLESRRKEAALRPEFGGNSLVSPTADFDSTIDSVAQSLREDGVAVIPSRLRPEIVHNLCDMARSCSMKTMTYGPPTAPAPGEQPSLPVASRGTSDGIDPAHPNASVYEVPRALVLENQNIQRLLCDPYLLAVATRYLGVFPVITKPEMWWDTDYVPSGLRPRPFHTDSGCLRWLKVGINLTDTTIDTPHFVYVKGSHKPNKTTRPLTKRLMGRMNLSHQEVEEMCADKIVRITAAAGSITLADTRGIHKGELSLRGSRLVLYFGLEGSAFNNIDKPSPVSQVGTELAQAMQAHPFSYQFFRTTD